MEFPWRLSAEAWLLFSVTLALQLVAGVTPLVRRGPVGLPRVALAAVGVASVTALACCVAFTRPHAGFAITTLGWLAGAFAVPACGAAVLLAARGRATRTARVCAWLGLGCLVPAVWASVIEPRRLTVERVQVAVDPARRPARPLVIGVLADLQTTDVFDHEERAVARLMAGEPDLILVPGDVVQESTDRWPELRERFVALFSQLRAPLGVYAVLGDIDRHPVLADLCERSGVRLLENEVVELLHAERPVVLLGLDQRSDRKPAMARFARRTDPAELRLVFAHQPRLVWNFQRADRVDLFVAGHTHGGQIQIPGFGPPVDLSPLPPSVTGGGLSEVDGVPVYVSRGVGMERGVAPRVRLFCPPEVSLVELR